MDKMGCEGGGVLGLTGTGMLAGGSEKPPWLEGRGGGRVKVSPPLKVGGVGRIGDGDLIGRSGDCASWIGSPIMDELSATGGGVGRPELRGDRMFANDEG